MPNRKRPYDEIEEERSTFVGIPYSIRNSGFRLCRRSLLEVAEN